MVKKFEADVWYNIDFLIDWEEQQVSVYVDKQGMLKAPFFTKQKEKIKSANAVSLYGLSPGGVSRFRNLQICKEKCDELGK